MYCTCTRNSLTIDSTTKWFDCVRNKEYCTGTLDLEPLFVDPKQLLRMRTGDRSCDLRYYEGAFGLRVRGVRVRLSTAWRHCKLTQLIRLLHALLTTLCLISCLLLAASIFIWVPFRRCFVYVLVISFITTSELSCWGESYCCSLYLAPSWMFWVRLTLHCDNVV